MFISSTQLLELHGYSICGSGGGCIWAVKEDPEDSRFYLCVTDTGGLDIPKTIYDPILYGKMCYDTGEQVSCEEWSSLRELFLGCRCGEESCQKI